MELEEAFGKPRLTAFLDYLGSIDDPHKPWRVLFLLREVPFLAVCCTIAGSDARKWARKKQESSTGAAQVL